MGTAKGCLSQTDNEPGTALSVSMERYLKPTYASKGIFTVTRMHFIFKEFF